ncbi:filamentous hemagglutinin family protein [Ereboglobus sp. PH5-5]|uniref:two-partner secretion domain-containing protein n=1 Tax=Ereboglobus sp. PH5-5 TaxID=2940529 RepID=UPI0024067130|nr:filamentous hemagglutinin N-terminal domain-containing protein [Ereboglobus sp. PH5-5]MDF9832736.1 filamentous hemagglutinin family protein [Ereboglobus sp. PH5-5]
MVTISRISFASAIIRTVLSAAIIALPGTSMRADAPVGTVVSGEASFDYNGNKTTITASNNAIIEYPKFNIDRNETVQFVQPTDTSRVLNRITGGDPSSILGSLQANGIVYFVNPAGIYFGQHATIDVGQFYAAAGNLSNANFLAGRDNFERLSGQVHNEGVINASAIHLIGQNVRNTGNLNSPAGLVMLAAGDDVLIGRRGEHVFVNATKTTPDASATAGVENAGNINAEGGRALLAAGDLYALAVQNSGVIRAHEITLAGQGSGEVWNRGTIDADSADTEGGRVEITGQYVGLSSESTIDASGATGGGEILIGGDYQGANADIRNATATYVAEGAAIRADATTSGSGGKVIVWADETTRFHGSISATGFTSGGFAEVSGKQNLLYTGLADLRSANGLAGTLLLDPDNLTISTAASTPGVIPGSVFTAPVSDTDWNLNTSDLATQLALASVTVQTATGDITVADTITWNNNSVTSLTLDAGNNLIINADILATGPITINLNADNDINIASTAFISASQVNATAIGSLTISGSVEANGVGPEGKFTANANSITFENGSYVSGSNHAYTATGNIMLDGEVDVTGSLSLNSTSGTITIGANSNFNNGIRYDINGGVNFMATTGMLLFSTMEIDGGGRDVTLGSYISGGPITVQNAQNINITGVVRSDSGVQSYQAANDILFSGTFVQEGPGVGMTFNTTTGTTIFASGAAVSLGYYSPTTISITGGFTVNTGVNLGFRASSTLAYNINGAGRDVILGAAVDLTMAGGNTLSITNANNLTLASVITNDAQSHTAANNLTVTGTLQTLNASQNISLSATSVSLASTSEINSTGTTAITGALDMASGAKIDASVMTVDALGGNIAIAGEVLTINGGTFTNAGTIAASGSINNLGSGDFTFIGNQAMTVGGMINATSGGNVNITVSAGTLSVASTGTVNGRNINISGGLNVASGAALTTPYGSGNITIDGLNRDVAIATAIDMGSGTFTLSNARNLALDTLITNDAQNHTATGGITVTGTLQTLNADQNISLSGTSVSLASTSEINSTGTTAITGALDMASGALIDADLVTVDALGGNIAIGGEVSTFTGGTFFNAANIAVTGTVTGASGNFVFTGNQAMSVGGVIDAGSGGSISLASTTGTVSVASTGTINSSNINISGGLNVASGAALTSPFGNGNITIDALNRDVAIATGLTLGSGSLAISNARDLALDTVITDDAQAYTATGGITLTGTLQANNADQNISLTGSAVSLSATSEIDTTGTVTITGPLDMVAGSAIHAHDTIVNALGGNITLGGEIMASGTYVNAAAINVTGTILGGGVFVASQSMTVGGVIDGDSDNDLSITVSTGTLALASSSTLGGRNVSITAGLDMASGASIVSLNDIVVDANGGNITLGGNVSTFTGGTFFNAANIAVTGTVTGASGNFVFTGNQAMSVGGVIDAGSGGSISLASTTGTVSVASTGTINSSNINITGGLNVASGAALTSPFGNGNITIDALNRDVAIATALTLGSGSLAITNARDLALDTVITDNAQAHTAARNLTLTGTLQTINTGEGVALTAQTGTLVTTAAAAIDSRGDITLNATTATLGGVIHTDETLTVATTAGALAITGTHDGSIAHITSATGVSISGALNFTGTNTINATTGTIAIAGAASVAGETINLNGGVRIDNGANLVSDLGLVIDALARDVVINAGLSLPELSIAAARYIETAAVATYGDQEYHFAPNGAGAMKINGALVSETGDITITSNSDYPAAHATIFSTSPNGILISATLGNVIIGHNDTLLAYHDGSAAPDAGTITIEAGGIASVGNLSASRRINVSANQIQLDGAVYQAPAIALSAVTSLDISGSAVTIATAGGAHDISPPSTGSYTTAIINGDAMSDNAMNASYFPLIATSTGAPYAGVYERTEFWSEQVVPDQEIKQGIVADEANPANRTEPEAQQLQEVRAAAAEAAFQQIDAETAISAATGSQLRKLGIFPRPLTPQERNELGARFGTLRQIIPSEIRAPENYQVADGRLSEQSARAAIAAYERAFETADGASRIPDLQAAIQKTYREFRAANPGAPAAQYVRYIDTIAPGTEETRSLHAFFEDVRALFLRIDRLGLTNNEALVSKNVILRPLRVQGAPSALLAPLMQVAPDTAPLVTASY